MKIKSTDDQRNENEDFPPAILNTEKIVNYRSHNRLTQSEFAARLGITAVSLSRWEKHKIFPNQTNLKKLARELQVDINDLIIIQRAPEHKERKPYEESERKVWHYSTKRENPQKAGALILPVLFEVHHLISEYVSFVEDDSELAIFESILNNSLLQVRTQKTNIRCQDESEDT